LGASGSVAFLTRMLDLVWHFLQRNSYIGIAFHPKYFSTAGSGGKVAVLVNIISNTEGTRLTP
jgi:hypothetical protein